MTEENIKHINYMQPLEATTPRKPLPIVGWRNGETFKATCKDNKTGVKIAKQS